MLSLASAPVHLAARVSVALPRFPKPAFAVPKYVPLSQNESRRSFITSRIAFAPEQAEIEPQENIQASEEKPKKERKASAKNTKASAKEGGAEKPEPNPIKITADMLPPPVPPSAYNRFLKEWFSKRPKGQNAGETAKAVAADWHALSEGEKQPYYDSYLVDREVYLEKRQEWSKNVNPKVLKELNRVRQLEGKPKLKKRRSVNQGDKPLGPFMQFMAEYRTRLLEEKLPATEISRRAGEAWRALPDEEKQQYHHRFRNEVDAWRARHEATAASA